MLQQRVGLTSTKISCSVFDMTTVPNIIKVLCDSNANQSSSSPMGEHSLEWEFLPIDLKQACRATASAGGTWSVHYGWSWDENDPMVKVETVQADGTKFRVTSPATPKLVQS